jgi:aminopeptidase N
MLRSELGEENFWKGMRLYYEKYRNKNAMTDDLRKVMEQVSGKDLSQFFHQWLYVAGQPYLKISTKPGNVKGLTDIIVEQTQDFIFSFNLDIRLKDSTGERSVKMLVDKKITRLSVKAAPDVELTADPDVRLLFSYKKN